eukprot:symbB.v1.2.011946.t1/scaffold813.1/size160256/2
MWAHFSILVSPSFGGMVQLWCFSVFFGILVWRVTSMCEDMSSSVPWWDAWKDAAKPGIGIHHVALLPRERCAFVSLIRRIRAERPAFRVLDIGASGNPWSVHAGITDYIFDFRASHHINCFSTEEIETESAMRCCASTEDACFDKLFTRERCCRGHEPVVVGLIDGDVTDALGEGWTTLLRLVEISGKFDLVITSHLLEDLSDPQVVVRQLPHIALSGLVAVPSKFSELQRRATHRGELHHRWIFTIEKMEKVMLAIPKLPYLENENSFKDMEDLARNDSVQDLALLWRGALPLQVVNGGWMGPNDAAVIVMLREALLGPDMVDDLAALQQM